MDLDVVLFYAPGQSLDGACADESIILDALRDAGLDARSVHLGDVRLGADGELEERDAATGEAVPWRDPHAALMYHGAIAPPDALELLATMEARGTVVVNGPAAWPVFTDKLQFAQYMDAHGVRVIPSRPVHTPAELTTAIDAVGGEAVVKEPVSTEGAGVYVVHDSNGSTSALAERLRTHADDVLLVQPIVDSRIDVLEPGIDALLLPGERGHRHEFRINTARMSDGSIEVIAAYMRVAPSAEQVVNNVAQGARPIRIDFDALHPDDRETMLQAARCAPPTGDLVGWDLLGQPGQRMVIEGNSGSGLPNGSEGIDPRAMVRAYGVVMRAAAERAAARLHA